MNKKFQRIETIKSRLREIADLMETENREMTDSEKSEVFSLRREKTMLELQLEGRESKTPATSDKWGTITSYVREVARGSRQIELHLREEGTEVPASTATETSMLTADMKPGDLVPLTVGDILYPVEEALIWDKIGVRIPTGLAGEYSWPVVDNDVEATFAGEGVDIDEVKVDLSKVSAVQQRVGIAMSETREAVFNSNGKVEEIIRKTIPASIAKAINKIVLSPTQVEGQTLKGPLVGCASYSTTYDFKGFNTAKAKLLQKGYTEEGFCWVMSYAMKAELEATPMDAGSGIMILRDNKLCGLPVFCTSLVGNDVYLGDWRYQVCGQFGTPSFIVDPYSKATAGKTRFVLNTNYGTATLRPDAFLKVTKK